ncbi:MAG: MBL fold metallo-hydrolase [Clostridia bacterium]|nr:MBL fold metallo-hydrolase [Clostridia bacterium]
MNIINLGNTMFRNYLLQFDNGCILIDAGYKTSYSAFLKKLGEVGIELSDIKYIFLTHVHNDHISYLKELLEAGVPIILHSHAKGRLLRGQNVLGDCSTFLSKFFSVLTKLTGKSNERWQEINAEDAIVCDGKADILRENGFPLSIVELPGHTPDTIGLMTDDGKLFCGDMTMNCFPAIKRKTLLIEDIDKYKQSWQKIIELTPLTLYPCHGKPFPVDDMVRYQPEVNNLILWRNK